MIKRTLFYIFCFFFGTVSAFAETPVVLYSTVNEQCLETLEEAFEEKYPGIDMLVFNKGIEDIISESLIGKINADIIWAGTYFDFESLKSAGILQPYTSPESEHIGSSYIDPDGYYTGTNPVTIGFVWNGDLISDEEAPKTWNDLLDPRWKKQVSIRNLIINDYFDYWVKVMMQNEKYGSAFFEKLYENGIKGQKSVLNLIEKSECNLGMIWDTRYIERHSAFPSVRFRYPEEDIISFCTPLGIIYNINYPDNGKLLYDFILSKEGQKILTENSMLSVRDDMDEPFHPTTDPQKHMKVDNRSLRETQWGYLNLFNGIFNQ